MILPSTYDILIRLALAFCAGVLIGLERENHGRAAGLRTTVLVAVAAAIAMVLSEHLFLVSGSATGSWRPDPARLAAGILTGMGFLGAGVIMREGRIVRGVTTAAGLWLTTVLGLTFGGGQIGLGIFGLVAALLILHALPSVERYVRSDRYGCVSITHKIDGVRDAELRSRLEKLGIVVKSVEIEHDLSQKQHTLNCHIKYKNADVFTLTERVIEQLAACEGVLSVKWA